MKIGFYGADRGVTGSCHLVSCNGKTILVDCGLYQGGREIAEENQAPFGFDPRSIDFLLLTHAHLDHCGRIPLLVKQGFTGEIITTAASKDLAKLVMLDSAHIQEEEAKWRSRRLARRGKSVSEAEPLYTRLDALDSLDYFGRTATYGQPISLDSGIKVTFQDAGHILGSACLLFELEEQGERRRVLFSGDLGYRDRAILSDPATAPKADVVVMETTYGDRLHKRLAPSVDELYTAITDTFSRGGNVIIPSFALERTQEILYFLREGRASGKLPISIQVFLDSPMAISATKIFSRHPECYDDDSAQLFANGEDPFGFPGLHFISDTAQSMALNMFHSGAVIIAGSGMCTGGRVRHHLKHNLWREHCSVVFVGFAARGTLARKIIDGAESVRIYGEEVSVRASIHTIGGFSAHADQGGLLAWHKQAGSSARTFLVHGEERAMEAFAAQLDSADVTLPEPGSEYEL